ncbi:polyketide synthase [Micromonospora sp. M12]
MLKRLTDALRDGDTVHAVIRGSAVNNDGARKAGFTAPGPTGQAAVIAAALEVADVDPDTVGLVETHGTGTALGDPIEVAALRQVFDSARPDRAPCALGAVKSVVGHLDTAAGVVGMIKTVLALTHRTIPPIAHLRTPNPAIRLDGSVFELPTTARPWAPVDGVRRAGVSAFGIGGTNAHVVLEEARQSRPDPPARPAARPGLCEDRRGGAGQPGPGHRVRGGNRPGDLADLAYTADRPRRAALAGRRPDRRDRRGRPAAQGRRDGSGARVALHLTGAGAVTGNRPNYDADPVYRRTVDEGSRCCVATTWTIRSGNAATGCWPASA